MAKDLGAVVRHKLIRVSNVRLSPKGRGVEYKHETSMKEFFHPA